MKESDAALGIEPSTPALDEEGQGGHSAEPSPATDKAETITAQQVEQILADLKIVKQSLRWVLLIGGFFAARAIFFHY